MMSKYLVVFFPVVSSLTFAVSPVQKVVTLLSNVEAKLVKDGAAEEVAYAAYAEWCQNGAKDKEYEIKTAKSDIEDLKATISKAEADVTTQTSKVGDLGAAISTNDNDLKAATGIREKENTEFTAAETELRDVVDTLERAINVLQRKLRTSAAAGLLQQQVDKKDIKAIVRVLQTVVEATSLSLQDKQKLVGLVQNANAEQDGDGDLEDDSDFGAPEAQAYEKKSGSIIDVLEDLKQKAVSQLEEARREETNARHNFEMLKQSLSDQIKVDTKELGQAKLIIHDATEAKAGAEGTLSVTGKDLADAQKVLKNMDSDCAARAADRDTSVKNRADELDAIHGALDALKSISGQNIVYSASSASFLQVRRGSGADAGAIRTRVDLANFEVVNLVRQLAKDNQSPALAQLAGQISTIMRDGSESGDDPFAKVKTLISQMIERLNKEAGEEATHKAYCDKEMAETNTKTAELNYDIEKYSSKIDKAKADSVMLKDEVVTLQGEVAETMKSQANADAVRKQEHETFVESKADLEQGLQAVRLGLKILGEYYQSEGASLAQQPAAPEVHSKAAGSGTSIIGMLEVVESDFGKSLAACKMTEDTAAVAYQKMSMESKVSKTMKDADIKYKTKEAASLDKSAMELKSDLDGAQTELDAVMEYTKNLRGMCVVKPESYDERKGRRTAELEGLKNALQILEGEAVFIQRTNLRHGRRS